MEATENDLPAGTSFRIEGFPTIKLVKAGTNEIVDYQGDRTLEGFTAFIEANAVTKGGFVSEESPEDTPKDGTILIHTLQAFPFLRIFADPFLTPQTRPREMSCKKNKQISMILLPKYNFSI